MTLLRSGLLALCAAVAACAGSAPVAESTGAASPPSVPAPTGQAPRIIALVVVDQLPAELLERYRSLWVAGFRRLLEEGCHFTRAAYPYDFTETAPGHTTLATGSLPAQHGIVSNDHWVRDATGTWREVYAVADPDSPILGLPNAQGRGPRNIMRPGLAAWVRDAHPGSQTFGVAKKDRSAVTLIGDVPGSHAYWLQARQGRFVTSRHYREAYPEWVDRFNRETMPAVLADTVWESSVPSSAAALSRPDTFAAEGNRVHTAFPHRAWLEAADSTAGARNVWVSEKPMLDSAVLELTLRALRELGLGQDDAPDFLAVGFSQTDYVGHDYGPGSREQLDNLLRLDRHLGRLFDALDSATGPGGWVLALSSDHGVLEVPEWVDSGQRVGRRLSEEELDSLELMVERAGTALRQGAAAPEALRALRAHPAVAAVYPIAALAAGERPDSFAVLYANGIFPGRVGDEMSLSGLRVRLQPRTLMSDANPATHGSPYWYDRHVPVFFMGAGVPAGASSEPISTTDVAPTLARLAGIPFPADLHGRARVLPARR
jgi:predicted AlkP superfamily pyrophosphatase or phosphodiesterase